MIAAFFPGQGSQSIGMLDAMASHIRMSEGPSMKRRMP
jgi:malonyl CoA-acyl carrier protein transacylase